MRGWIICVACVLSAAVLYAFTRTSAALVLLCVSIFVPCASIILCRLGVSGISVSFEVPVGLQKGAKSQCVLMIENRSVIPAAHIGMTLRVRNNLTGKEQYIPLDFAVSPREKRELPFGFENKYCGQFLFSCENLRVYDFLRLQSVRKTLAVQVKRLVPPETFQIQATLLGSDVSSGLGEIFTVDRCGQDRSEPFQIRDYIKGDNVKSIHWKLSSKLDKYIVIDPSLELERNLLLIWDSGSMTSDALPEIPDALAEAFVSLCLALTGDGVPYSIAWQSVDTGDIAIKVVDVTDDIYDVIPEILHTGTNGERHSIIPEFLQEIGMRRFPTIAYFAAQVPTELDELAQLGRVTVFLCSQDGGAVEDDANRYEIFSPANYVSILRNVTI